MPKGERLAELFIDVRTRLDRAEKELKQLKGYATKKGKDAGKGFSSGWVKGMAIATAAFFAFRKALSIATQAKNLARDAEEIKNKFDVVFETIKAKANKTAEVLASSFQLANSTAKELLGNTGDILVGFGFTEDAALDLSKRVTELSVDLASFTNFEGGAARASEALTKAILGETESAKALGIVLRQGTKEFKASVKALQESEGMTYNQAMATTLLNEAYRQSTKAIGDFERTSGSLANQEKILNETLKESGELLGDVLVPAFLKVTKFANQALTSIGNYVKALRNIEASNKAREVSEKLSEELSKLTIQLIELQTIQMEAFSPEIAKAIKVIENQINKLIGTYEKATKAAEDLSEATAIPTIPGGREFELDISRRGQPPSSKGDVTGIWKLGEKETTPIEDLYNDAEKFEEIGTQAMYAFEDAALSAFDAIKSNQNVFKAMADVFVSAVQRMIAEWLAFKAVQAIGNMILPGLGTALTAGSKFAKTGGTFQGGQKIASFASGTDRFKVPFDNYPILTHRNEIVKVTPAGRAGDEAKILSEISQGIGVMNATLLDTERRMDVKIDGVLTAEGQSLKKVYDKTDQIHDRFH